MQTDARLDDTDCPPTSLAWTYRSYQAGADCRDGAPTPGLCASAPGTTSTACESTASPRHGRYGVGPDNFAVAAALSSCADARAIELGLWVHGELGLARCRPVPLDRELVRVDARHDRLTGRGQEGVRSSGTCRTAGKGSRWRSTMGWLGPGVQTQDYVILMGLLFACSLKHAHQFYSTVNYFLPECKIRKSSQAKEISVLERNAVRVSKLLKCRRTIIIFKVFQLKSSSLEYFRW